MVALPKKVTIIEVSVRDGIEGLKREIPVDFRVDLINRLLKTGIHALEVGAFVSPKMIPALKDTVEVYRKIPQASGVRYISLVPNMHGFNDALAAEAKEITVFTAASASFTKANINCTIEESLERFQPIIEMAKKHEIKVRGGISTVIECPYEGPIDPTVVATIAKKLLVMGCHEISLGDSNGFGTPEKIKRLISCCTDENIPVDTLAMHFHNTYGQAIANIYAGLEMGISTIESAVGGLGGCPNAPGATGNVATEDVI